MGIDTITGAKKRVLECLKRKGPLTAAELAQLQQMTGVAMRQHLLALHGSGLVDQTRLPADGRGRPSMIWSLTPAADRLFPDRHGELTVGLIHAIRQTYGDDGVKRIVNARATEQIDAYQKQLPPRDAPLRQRVEALARQRTAEGYMADVVEEKTGTLILIEHHCPICEAASFCTGLCGAELDVFRTVLGDKVTVERTDHLLSGGDRCVYRITHADAVIKALH